MGTAHHGNADLCALGLPEGPRWHFRQRTQQPGGVMAHPPAWEQHAIQSEYPDVSPKPPVLKNIHTNLYSAPTVWVRFYLPPSNLKSQEGVRVYPTVLSAVGMYHHLKLFFVGTRDFSNSAGSFDYYVEMSFLSVHTCARRVITGKILSILGFPTDLPQDLVCRRPLVSICEFF